VRRLGLLFRRIGFVVHLICKWKITRSGVVPLTPGPHQIKLTVKEFPALCFWGEIPYPDDDDESIQVRYMEIGFPESWVCCALVL